MKLLGVDFTSAPGRRKPIVCAWGAVQGAQLQLHALERLVDWPAFEALLARPGPWCGGFDFPFGLPRQAVVELGWPQEWPALVRHCAQLGKPAFRAALNAHRAPRPAGARYLHRATDSYAGAHSSLKLVNPPVGLMFLAGTPRLLASGVSLPGILSGDPQRIALEAYPGLLARRLGAGSYKSDDRARQNSARAAERLRLVTALRAGSAGLPQLCAPQDLIARLIEDAAGDSLDAVLALTQAAWAWLRREQGWGLPAQVDPLEGWIVSA